MKRSRIFSNWTSRRPRRNRDKHKDRRLTFELLDHRQMLSGLPLFPADGIQPDPYEPDYLATQASTKDAAPLGAFSSDQLLVGLAHIGQTQRQHGIPKPLKSAIVNRHTAVRDLALLSNPGEPGTVVHSHAKSPASASSPMVRAGQRECLVRVSPDEAIEDRGKIEDGHVDWRKHVDRLFLDSKARLIPVADKLIVKGQARDAEEATQIMALVETVWAGEKEEKHTGCTVSDFAEQIRMIDDIFADRSGWS